MHIYSICEISVHDLTFQWTKYSFSWDVFRIYFDFEYTYWKKTLFKLYAKTLKLVDYRA
jgi:hypothetical protein